MAAPFDANAVSIYGKFSQFELLTSGSSQPEASASVLRMFASGNGMSEAEILSAMPASFATPIVPDLSREDPLWGRPLPDQRLLVTTSRVG